MNSLVCERWLGHRFSSQMASEYKAICYYIRKQIDIMAQAIRL